MSLFFIFVKRFHFFIAIFSAIIIQSNDHWSLPRLAITDQLVVQTQKEHESREFRRTIKNSAIVGSAIVGIYWLYAVKNHFDQLAIKEMVIAEKEKHLSMFSQLDEKSIKKISQSLKAAPKEAQSLFFKGLLYLKDGSWSLSKSLIQNGLTISLGAVVNQSVSAISAALKNKYKPESILWFLREKTQINTILSDLKSKAIAYDLHATALSLDGFNQESAVLLKSVINDFSEHIMFTNRSEYSEEYLQYLIKELKKKYIRQGARHDEHFDAVLQAVMYAKRNELHDQDIVFQGKHDIKELTCLLKEQLESLIAFIVVRSKGLSNNRIDFIIAQANSMLAIIEENLQADRERLVIMSKSDRGMYTAFYLFEKMLTEEINFFHKYCRLD